MSDQLRRKGRACLPGANLGDVDVEITGWISLEWLLGDLVAGNRRQPADAMALEAPMQGRPSEVGDRCLQGVKTVVQWQKCVLAESDDNRFLLRRQDGRAGRFGSHRGVIDEGALTPLGDRLLVQPIPRR